MLHFVQHVKKTVLIALLMGGLGGGNSNYVLFSKNDFFFRLFLHTRCSHLFNMFNTQGYLYVFGDVNKGYGRHDLVTKSKHAQEWRFYCCSHLESCSEIFNTEKNTLCCQSHLLSFGSTVSSIVP